MPGAQRRVVGESQHIPSSRSAAAPPPELQNRGGQAGRPVTAEPVTGLPRRQPALRTDRYGFYRPDAPTAKQQRQLVRDLVEQCAEVSLPLVVEPIWHPLEGEDETSAEWRARRVEGIIASAQSGPDGCGHAQGGIPRRRRLARGAGSRAGRLQPARRRHRRALGDPVGRGRLRRLPHAGRAGLQGRRLRLPGRPFDLARRGLDKG